MCLTIEKQRAAIWAPVQWPHRYLAPQLQQGRQQAHSRTLSDVHLYARQYISLGSVILICDASTAGELSAATTFDA